MWFPPGPKVGAFWGGVPQTAHLAILGLPEHVALVLLISAQSNPASRALATLFRYLWTCWNRQFLSEGCSKSGSRVWTHAWSFSPFQNYFFLLGRRFWASFWLQNQSKINSRSLWRAPRAPRGAQDRFWRSQNPSNSAQAALKTLPRGSQKTPKWL